MQIDPASALTAFLAVIVSVIFGITSNSKAKKANTTAEQALKAAEAANTIADQANTLSEESNEIAKSHLARQSDPSQVEWAGAWDPATNTLTLTNKGLDQAFEVAAVITSKHIEHQAKIQQPIGRNESHTFEFPEITERRIAENTKAVDLAKQYSDNGIVTGIRMFSEQLTIKIRWQSELGNPGAQELHVRAR